MTKKYMQNDTTPTPRPSRRSSSKKSLSSSKPIKYEDLEMQMTKLNYLCEHFDPFDPDSTSTEVQNIISEFKLSSFQNDPFEFTKHLLKLIEETQQDLKINHEQLQ